MALALQVNGMTEEASYRYIVDHLEERSHQDRRSTYRKKALRPLDYIYDARWLKNMARAYAIVLQPPSKDIVGLSQRVIDLVTEVDEEILARDKLLPALFERVMMPDLIPSSPDLIPRD